MRLNVKNFIFLTIVLNISKVQSKLKVRHRYREKYACKGFNVMENFDVSKFGGTWFEILAYPNLYTSDGKCVLSTYAEISFGIFDLYVKFVDSLGNEMKSLGRAEYEKPGILSVKFPSSPIGDALFHIISTDYENYAVVGACNKFTGLYRGNNVWILSRTSYLDPRYLASALTDINNNGLSITYLKWTPQVCGFSSIF
ncbi:CLUMA_CG003614, isoform A [Clunio marinus]|uniref:CLUMA_CG003614, isoform A n=1 Tax=Clunio marinus TaxID=568069 RepID=A0A1J1HP65_9DIPT|nr:CLUMA_CG003614, isoform A [Clunio marinus]